jgi:ABC-type uncharacterized transport system substrate-binding protein
MKKTTKTKKHVSMTVTGLLVLIILASLAVESFAESKTASDKKKILVISSYHREYAWTQETNEGLCAAMLKLGYLDNQAQAEEYTKKDYVESSRIILKKLWMDTKRKKSKEERAGMTIEIVRIAGEFNPDIMLLGDDNAAKYIGNQFLDSDIPIVFWGVNNTPVKYGLVDSKDSPGHNVTGVYQRGYYAESIELVKSLAPGVRTFAILSDDTSSGRSHAKKISYLARKGDLPLTLAETVATHKYEIWKEKALELQNKVDAFFLAQYSGLKDKNGKSVPAEEVTAWYMNNIKVPEAAVQGQFVKQGMLCSADDSGYNQGFEAGVIANDILANGADPSTYSPRTPGRGPLMVNRQRAEILGIKLTDKMGIEEYIEEASALNAKTHKTVRK